MKTTIRHIQKKKERREPIVMLTAYDYTSARLAADAGVDMILVGDSLGMVIQGYETTLPVTLEEMIYHTRAVVRGAPETLVIADMPFMTYQISPEQALANAGRLMQESGAQAVKLEGGAHMASTVARLVEVGIPVMAHIGLTPQSVNQLGGWRAQGRTAQEAERLIEDALALEQAGAFAVVLELVPAELAAHISAQLSIPTIGIGAGPGCDGQVQVWHDILGLFDDFQPRHARRYAELGSLIRQAVARYCADVRSHRFPTDEHAPHLSEELSSLYAPRNGRNARTLPQAEAA
ncbi:MAG: 3-methyl-2-oxobutanoate hydroxymethyltransferase [Caldilineae bacterium]|nr:MAG: 3-methyl-2-oxobutanoate hydroxymethyltransferase [Caldilineae bacterium]